MDAEWTAFWSDIDRRRPELFDKKISSKSPRPNGSKRSAPYPKTIKCGKCAGCRIERDCGRCKNCQDKPKFGGPGRRKQSCVTRRCNPDPAIASDDSDFESMPRNRKEQEALPVISSFIPDMVHACTTNQDAFYEAAVDDRRLNLRLSTSKHRAYRVGNASFVFPSMALPWPPSFVSESLKHGSFVQKRPLTFVSTHSNGASRDM